MRLEGSVDTDVVVGRHVEVGRLWGVVRSLLGNVECLGTGRIDKVPVAGEPFSENGVERLLDTAATVSIATAGRSSRERTQA